MPAAAVRAVAFWLGSVGFAVLPYSPAAAQSSGGSPPRDWPKQETMTGNWDGNRTRLEQAGISVRGGYTTESAYNPIGGQFSAARYMQQFDLGADFDLDRLAGIPGGKVVTTLTDRKGRSLSADALGNNRYAVQEVFGGGQITRVVELHYQQELFDKKFLFDIGWEPLGMYFAMSPLWCSFFQTLATCGTVSINSSSSWQDWPFGQWGARVRFQPNSAYYVSTGVYQVNPANASQGFDLTFGGTGVIVPFEFGWLTGQGRHGMLGEYKLGGYFDSSPTPDVLLNVSGLSAGLAGGPFAQHNGRWGLYAQASQLVYREARGSARGLTLFGMATLSDPKTATLRYSLTAGAVYQGTFPKRDADFVSLVFAYGRYNSRLTQFQEDLNIVTPGVVGVQTFESVVEVDYGIAVTPWLQVRPNLQYVIRPRGTGQVQDAFVIGLFTRVTF
jgi:porin